MSPVLNAHDPHNVPTPQGHTIGFVETEAECEALCRALHQAGFADAAILILRGADGQRLLDDMMKGSLWGESAEEVLKQGTVELSGGHSVMCVEVQDADQAATVAAVSTQHGGHGIHHFGLLVDTRLTA